MPPAKPKAKPRKKTSAKPKPAPKKTAAKKPTAKKPTAKKAAPKKAAPKKATAARKKPAASKTSNTTAKKKTTKPGKVAQTTADLNARQESALTNILKAQGLQAKVEAKIVDAVKRARKAGLSWRLIAGSMDVSVSTAFNRYADQVDDSA